VSIRHPITVWIWVDRARGRSQAQSVRADRSPCRQRCRRYATHQNCRNDPWILNRSKAFIPNSWTPINSNNYVTGRTESGMTSLLVEAVTPGLNESRPTVGKERVIDGRRVLYQSIRNLDSFAYRIQSEPTISMIGEMRENSTWREPFKFSLRNRSPNYATRGCRNVLRIETFLSIASEKYSALS
jgi:hypothetical protein